MTRCLMLIAVLMVVAGCTSVDSPRQQIEKHLGVSAKGKRILDKYMFDFSDGAPDMAIVRDELLKCNDMQNLTVGLLMMPWTDELDVETINADIGVTDVRLVLDTNFTRAGTTLVRPEDVSNVTVETNVNGRVVGSFDWIVPNQFRGRARFVIKGNKLEYLGILRKESVGIYDCETIISPYGDIFSSQQWFLTKYFVVIEPKSRRTRELARVAQQRELVELFKSTNPSGICRDESLPLVYIADRDYRDKVVTLLLKSDDWKTGLVGRAVGTLMGASVNDSIKEQVRKVAKHEMHPSI